VNLHKQTVKTA